MTVSAHRKVVTVLFCDVVGSTELGELVDPEALQGLLARYFERMKGIVESHGGSVEKFIGDAVMAVFGVPVAHEDDALRACRAAVEMRDALPGLGVSGRIGVNTGEVLTGTEERLATGDAVNVAARLEQAAKPSEVLIGKPTLALVAEAAEVDPVEPLELKGKAVPVPAFRLLCIRATPERRHGASFVGRERELAILQVAWERVQSEQRCELVTIVGDAGVGKSRLAAEFLASIEAAVVRGRCLPYGEGITYWPVVEVLKQLDLLPVDEAAAASIRSLLGESEATTSPEDIAWAFRKTLEHASAERPLVAVFDDIQWGEQTFLDLLEHVALLSSGASILLLCMARPELTERQSAWPVPLRLEPLADDDVDELIPQEIPAELRAKIMRAAGGNPLFVEGMLAMARETEGEVVVPPTLQALLIARLDQLDPAERSVLERGAVEGEIFHRGAVQALAPAETQVTPRLAALVRKELIRPDKPQLVSEDGFRFRHLLIRDATYDALPKATRAELHERFASWLQEHGIELVELDEILGYHLEQTCLYRAELRMPLDAELAAAARGRLTAAGRQASVRQDYRAAVRLFERALALVPATAIDVGLETDFIDALYRTGEGIDALRHADSLSERAAIVGDQVGELCGRIKAGLFRLLLGPAVATDALVALLDQALPVLEAASNDLALYTAYSALGEVENFRARMDALLEAFERAAAHARNADLPYQLLEERALGRYFGASPVSQLLVWLDEQEARERHHIPLRMYRGRALAMLARFDEARALLAHVRAELTDRGGGSLLATAMSRGSFDVELLAGDPAAAAELGEEGCRLYEELGETSRLSSAAGRLAQALYALDRLEEAEAWTDRCVELGTSDDVLNEMLWRQPKAKVLARRGEHAEAKRLAHEAVAIGEETDLLDAQGDAYADLAEVLVLGGMPDEAAAALEQALARYQRKGNLASTQRVQTRLAEFQDAARP